ncbi:MAG: DsbA family protein [Halobaculum sp.]
MDERIQRDGTRRKYLAAVAAGGAASLGGCLGVLGGGGSSYDCSGEGGEKVTEAPQPALGSSDAPVTVKVWEDFSCPHCKTFSLDVFPKIREEYVSTGKVRYEHHDFPIPVREWAWGAASAGRAVHEATDAETFFAFAKEVFSRQNNYGMGALGKSAEAVGAEPCTPILAAKNGTYRPVIEADRQRGSEMGVQGTPAIFVDGEQLTTDSRGFDAVSSLIEQKL